MSDLSPECAPKRTSARATPGLFKEVQLNQGRPRAMASVRTTDIGFPLVSFSESSGLSICSHPSGRTGLFPSLFSVSGPFSGGMPRGFRQVALSISFLSPIVRRPAAFAVTKIASLIFRPERRFLALTSFQSLTREPPPN